MCRTVVGLAAYVAASDSTRKGVIHGINANLSEEELTQMIVTQRNPDAPGIRRIKKTQTVIALFDEKKVHQHVLCDGVRYPCSLYPRQVDMCYDLGHRSNVWPRGEDQNKCCGCGVQSPSPDHQWDLTCAICGDPYPTVDRKFRKCFQVPYVVRHTVRDFYA
ncbi:hypothetical protein HPB51_005826 [Rhipicephalus microplus]|uniref:Uncharacterized protein n=1 Tax=Rhipicephalus microplus TaxID=6941 RepID=A0A9J6D858_RHIMP|nr:hypothetical protein HPB51_005826 [Rhipicephalus microplus]